MSIDDKPRVAVVYHFFAHYRLAVISEMAHSAQVNYEFLADTKDYQDSIKAATLPSHATFWRCRCIPLYKAVMWQCGLLRAAFGTRYDALIFLPIPYWPATWLASALARLRGKRVLFWTHGWVTEPKGLKGVLRNTLYSLADGLLLYGHYAKQIGISQGFEPSRLHVIFNSLDFAAQREAEDQLPADSIAATRNRIFDSATTPVVICITRLTQIRRLDLLLQAMKLLKDDGLESNLILIGDGPQRQQLEALSDKLGIRTAFQGAIYEESEIAPLLKSANVLVAPGKSGLTTMHSLGYGIPMVTHGDVNDQMPEFEAIIPAKTGDLFERGNVEDLAEKMKPWLMQPAIRPQVAGDCKEIIRRFYTAWFQRAAIDRAVLGAPADDLFFLREGQPKPCEATS